jgi:glyoxylase-like metal-dependent hydrolase (beta-lactamase superfamily II)
MIVPQLLKVTDGLYYFESRTVSPFAVSGVYLIVRGEVLLIEAGTSISVPHLLKAIEGVGIDLARITTLVPTHVHLDHAGGAGRLVEKLPHLKVWVHNRGLRHLADPSRLIKSAEVLYGTRDNITRLHGEILPIPMDNLVGIEDGVIPLADGPGLQTLDTPGHAPHHLSIFDPVSQSLFCGEALGHYLPEYRLLYPAVAPPGFDLAINRATIEKLRTVSPARICFSQFGWQDDPEWVFSESCRQLDDCARLVKTGLNQGLDDEGIVDRLQERLASQGMKSAGQSGEMLHSIVLGYKLYFQRQPKAYPPHR